MIQIKHLFVSPGHNYFGHHGGPAGTHPVLEREQIECVAGRGIRGDRFFDYAKSDKGQITFFSQETFDDMCRELELAHAEPSATRRNVFVTGADLNSLVGIDFEIQGVRFIGVEECRPCYWMNQAFGDPRTEEWLKGRGGLRARLLNDGVLKCDSFPKRQFNFKTRELCLP